MIPEKAIDYQGVMEKPADSRMLPKNDDRIIRLVYTPKPRLIQTPTDHSGPPPTDQNGPARKKIFVSPRPKIVLAKKAETRKTDPQKTQLLSNQPFFSSRRYRILGPIAHGGMGTVYKAWDTLLGLTVAIKLVPPHMQNDPVAIRRLRQEAAAVIQLSHPNIVKLHNIEVEDGHMFLVMEYLDGETLRQRLRRHGALELPDVLAVLESCAAALTSAHGRGILHRDLKPENIMVTSKGVVKIVDFGAAFPVAEIQDGELAYVEGTPSYMSPEQARNQPLDARTDVYSLGLVIYELLTGFSAFPLDAGMQEIVEMQMEAMTGIPEEIAAVLAKAVEKNREYRWKSVEEFCAAFRRAAKPYCG